MTLFQFLQIAYISRQINQETYLDRLKELKASKEKELEEIIKAMESVQPKKNKASNNNDLGPKYSVGDVLYTSHNSETAETILEVKYSITIGDYMYRTDKSNGFITQSWVNSHYVTVKRTQLANEKQY